MKIGVLTLAALATAETENFYENGLDKISSDFDTLLANTDIKDAVVKRYLRKVKQNVKRLEAKHKKLKRMARLNSGFFGNFDSENSNLFPGN